MIAVYTILAAACLLTGLLMPGLDMISRAILWLVGMILLLMSWYCELETRVKRLEKIADEIRKMRQAQEKVGENARHLPDLG